MARARLCTQILVLPCCSIDSHSDAGKSRVLRIRGPLKCPRKAVIADPDRVPALDATRLACLDYDDVHGRGASLGPRQSGNVNSGGVRRMNRLLVGGLGRSGSSSCVRDAPAHAIPRRRRGPCSTGDVLVRASLNGVVSPAALVEARRLPRSLYAESRRTPGSSGPGVLRRPDAAAARRPCDAEISLLDALLARTS
jgi:hypothetical protein